LELLCNIRLGKSYEGRNLKGKPKDMERFHCAYFVASETHRIIDEHKIVPRFGYVVHEHLRDPGKYEETVAVNRGVNVKVFETLEDAIECLTNPR
jgi:hypothetical protein